MPMFNVPRSQQNVNRPQSRTTSASNQNFFSKLFGSNDKAAKEAPPRNGYYEQPPPSTAADKTYIPKSLQSVKPSFSVSEFQFVKPQDSRFLIDGLPPEQSAYGVQLYGDFSKKKTLPDDYCECDVCLKKESNPLPPEKTPTPLPTIQDEPIIEEEEEVEPKKVAKPHGHDCCNNCCSCCCCCKRGGAKRKSRGSRQDVRLVINVD